LSHESFFAYSLSSVPDESPWNIFPFTIGGCRKFCDHHLLFQFLTQDIIYMLAKSLDPTTDSFSHLLSGSLSDHSEDLWLFGTGPFPECNPLFD